MIEKTSKGIKYRLDEVNLTAEVIAKRNDYEGDFIIPEIVVFKKVAYRVTSIEGYTFDGCDSLTSIIIPESVTSIGDSAFEGCSSLTSIVIPDSVTSIGGSPFWCCFSLTSITFNGTKAQWNRRKFSDNWKKIDILQNKVPTEVIHCTDGEVEI